MKRFTTILFAVALALASGAAIAAEFDMARAENIFITRCTKCHGKSRVLTRNKNREGWTKTIKRMIRKPGSPVGESDVEVIVEYLVRVRGPL